MKKLKVAMVDLINQQQTQVVFLISLGNTWNNPQKFPPPPAPLQHPGTSAMGRWTNTAGDIWPDIRPISQIPLANARMVSLPNWAVYPGSFILRATIRTVEY